MITHFDHVTIVVRDVAKAKAFFGMLGFVEQQSVTISGAKFSNYMGIALTRWPTLTSGSSTG